MDTSAEEYKALRRQIEAHFRLIVQVFTASIISTVALFGYFFQLLARSDGSVSHLMPFLLLAPLAISIPCAYFIGSLRREIFKFGTYVQIYLEDRKGWRYETELCKYREHHKEEESLYTITFTYWALFLMCAISFWWGLNVTSVPLWWLFLLGIPGFLMIRWHRQYKAIPTRDRKIIEERWRAIKSEPAHR